MEEIKPSSEMLHSELIERLGCFEHAEALVKIKLLVELNARFASAPRAVSKGCDLEAMTWAFGIEDGCRVGAGKYALIKLRPNTGVNGARGARRPFNE